MMTIAELTELLGWGSVINIGFLMLSFFAVTFMRKIAVQIHSNLFGLKEEDLLRAYFQYLAQYKIVVLVFFVVPYLALKIMN
jgi:Family of unknown function (DUF6868)